MTTSTISLEKAQEIYGDEQAIQRGYVTENSIKSAHKLAQTLLANGFTARDGMAIFPDRFHLTSPVEDSLQRKEAKSLDCLTAYFMDQV